MNCNSLAMNARLHPHKALQELRVAAILSRVFSWMPFRQNFCNLWNALASSVDLDMPNRLRC